MKAHSTDNEITGIYLHLGSNVGDRFAHMQEAIEAIRSEIGQLVQRSLIYETQAWGRTAQADFLNCVLEIRSTLTPEDMLDRIHDIERRMGRIRMKKWAPRCMDIDILFYADLIVQSERLCIPHHQIEHRNFVLVPMLEVAPYLVHPVHKKTIEELYIESTDRCEVIQLDE